MPTPTTATEALRDCEKVWEYLAENPTCNKDAAVTAVLDYRPASACPACEWADIGGAGHFCKRCPIDTWRYESKIYNLPCVEQLDSPYMSWGNAKKTRSPFAIQAAARAALDVVKLVQESKAYRPMEKPDESK